VIEFDDRGPVLVFGGPYSNLEATRAMRAEAARLAIPAERVICTGDVVAYAADPEETVALVRDWGIQVVAGNCEEQLAEGAADCGCGFAEGTACDLLAKGWYPYADGLVSAESRAWMARLPKELTFGFCGVRFRVIHGGGRAINRFLFASDRAALTEELADIPAVVVVAGHAGLPFISRLGQRVWFNPGVIGMPANDGTPEVWYGLIRATDEGVRLSTHRLAYDHLAAAAAVRRSGHGNGYARTLVTGLWPSLDILPEPERAATGKRLRSRSLVVRSAAGVPALLAAE
jgi:predicted phosphodiesterase